MYSRDTGRGNSREVVGGGRGERPAFHPSAAPSLKTPNPHLPSPHGEQVLAPPPPPPPY